MPFSILENGIIISKNEKVEYPIFFVYHNAYSANNKPIIILIQNLSLILPFITIFQNFKFHALLYK